MDPGYFPLAPSCCVWKSKKRVGRGKTAGSDGPPSERSQSLLSAKALGAVAEWTRLTHIQDKPWGPRPGSPNHDLKLQGKPPP